jgi:hypothetical protein
VNILLADDEDDPHPDLLLLENVRRGRRERGGGVSKRGRGRLGWERGMGEGNMI